MIQSLLALDWPTSLRRCQDMLEKYGLNLAEIAVVHKLNERLASQGKRFAERAAIDIIQQVTDGYGKPEDHV